MSEPLCGKRVVLGVSGSIACYKAADLASKLTQQGAQVDVILTHSAREFITPLTFRSVTNRQVFTELFASDSETYIEHISLAEKADIIVVAPATANVVAKIAIGLADDMLTTTLLATRAPVLVAPAMDGYMFDNPATQTNMKTLRKRGIHIAGPSIGHLASGLEGPGRLLEVHELIGHIRLVLGKSGDLSGRKIVVSAGGTQESIDPVRVVANRSSGKMGYAIAEAARDRGAQVTLISAPTALPNPVGIEIVCMQTALEMRDAVLGACENSDALIMAAAVGDYRPAKISRQKVKKSTSTWTLNMTPNPDILKETPPHLLKIGFAAESERAIEHGWDKLRKKKLDLIAVNDVTANGSGFAHDTNKVVILFKDGRQLDLPLMSKYDVAHRLLDAVHELLP